MKSKILALLLISFLSILLVSGQNSSKKSSPSGTWKFEAPTSQEGYTSGTIVIELKEQKYTVTVTFTGSDYKIPGEKVKFENDILNFVVYVEGEEIKISLKLEDNLKMVGKAVYSGGDIPVTLRKVTEEVKQKQK